jgi:chromosome segregation ATPase
MKETSNNGLNKNNPLAPASPQKAGGESKGIDAQFNTISGKLQQLLKKQSRLQKENEQLRQELEESRKKRAAYEQHILELEHRITVLKLGSGDMPEKDRKQFEKTLNHYIREIDKCIAYISQ